VVGLGVVELHRVQLEHSSGSHLLRKPEVLAIRVTTASEKFDKTLFVSVSLPEICSAARRFHAKAPSNNYGSLRYFQTRPSKQNQILRRVGHSVPVALF
jgi:hypothetical protein